MHKPQTTDDIGITANNSNEVTDCSQNRSKSPFIQFFVSFWARVKFLFTTALAEACDCSSHSKGKSSYGDSCSVKGEDDIEVCVDLIDSAYAFNTTVATVFDQEPLELPNTAQSAKDIGVQRCEEAVDTPVVEAAICTLLRESSHRLENFYTTLDDTDDTEPIAEMHLEPVEQSDVGPFSNAVAFAQPIMLASLKPQAHFPELLLVVEKSHFFDFPTVFEEDEGEFGLENDFPGESLCSSLEVPNHSGHIHPVTVLGRLHTKMRNGDITADEYNTLADSIIASTIPRNLSDSEVTRKPHGANQLYAWQLPPPLPESTGDEVPSPPDKQVTDVSDAITFIDSVISDAVMEVSNSFNKEKEHTPPFLHLIDRSSRAEEDSFYLNLPCPADVSYDGLQTASLDRIRSTCTSHSSCKVRSSRSSSLKSERSPDETPCRKIVRFADSLGLDLATVRQVKDADNPPLIPASATLDLNLDTEKSFSTLGAKQFQICFPQPGASANFMHRVLNSFVCLENARVDSSRGLLTGTVRVKSVGFEKKVALRITYNNWATFFEVPASYVQDSHDGSTDRFSFSAVFPSTMVANERAQFAVRYETHSGDIYWDNNHGENYQIHCYAKATDIAGDGSWIHYL